MATNTPSRYEDIISKSDLIKEGPPAVYQLKPEKQTAGSVRRMTLGEKNPNKTNKTILLVGETGTGKSTLVNTLVNYAMGVKQKDDVWFEIVEDEKRRQTESQTSDVIVYQIFGFEDKTLPYSLTIIDTPGYGDTRGTEKDVFISKRLLDLFRSEDGVHEINAVGVVLKASVNQLDDRLNCIFNLVVSLFGKDMEKKIVALMTHSNRRPPKESLKALDAANIKCTRNEKNQPVHFQFDNCQTDDRTEDTEDLEHAEQITTQGMSQLTDFLEKSLPAPRIFVDTEKISGWVSWVYGATRCLVCQVNCHYRCFASSPKNCVSMKEGHCTVCNSKCPESNHVTDNYRFVN